MKTYLIMGFLILSTHIVCAQTIKANTTKTDLKDSISSSKNYSFTIGLNTIDNGESNSPLNSVYSFKTPFFFTAERRFNSKLSLALNFSTNRLSIDSVEKFYTSIDAGGQFYFNEYLFNTKKVEMYTGLGIGRYFLENKGNNTLNITGGLRYWLSNQYGISFQGFGKVGLSPINTSVLNHYQYNLGLIWRPNRNKQKEEEVVYKIEEIIKTEPICEQELIGTITDKATGNVLPNTLLTVFDNEFKVIETKISDIYGRYSFKVVCGKKYNIRAEKEEYNTIEQNNTIATENGKTALSFVLQKKECEFIVGSDLGKCFGIKMIYFAVDKYFINNQNAILELEKILFVLNQNPTLKIDIRSHTDCRQSLRYNMELSDKRAKTTLNWLVKNGIDKSRLTAQGYGQTQLVNDCNCSSTKKINCTEDQHRANRRSEFIITAL